MPTSTCTAGSEKSCDKTASQDSFFRARSIFINSLSIVYLIAFISVFLEIDGLLGPQGLHPVNDFLKEAKAQLPVYERLWLIPSVFWLSSTSTALSFTTIIGALSSLAVMYHRSQRVALLLCWLLYLSIVAVGGPFFQYQWDSLLLETGFLAIFLPTSKLNDKSSSSSLFLLHWLAFRLMFSSGIAKLVSQDPSWRSLKALSFHFETQPLPTPLAYYVDKLPDPILQTSCALTLIIELVFPFLFFATPKMRRFAALSCILLQVLIALTGNFGFFNLLSIILCLSLLDDSFLRRPLKSETATLCPRFLSTPSIAVVLLSVVPLLGVATPSYQPPTILKSVYNWTGSFRLINSYGLFSVMTRERLSVVIEGSNDGELWQEYKYRWYPQSEARGLNFIAPFHPRLDWQIWFTQFSPPQRIPWFRQLVGGILADSKPILSLLDNEGEFLPPTQIRALLYRYEFTKRHDRKILGKNWERTLLGLYLHPVKATKD